MCPLFGNKKEETVTKFAVLKGRCRLRCVSFHFCEAFAWSQQECVYIFRRIRFIYVEGIWDETDTRARLQLYMQRKTRKREKRHFESTMQIFLRFFSFLFLMHAKRMRVQFKIY